ncbi:MAG: Crp/Fnr family transcriptional regulator [bacterium]|nr:Crp/Fnr family transcriptional regulator [bacterium]
MTIIALLKKNPIFSVVPINELRQLSQLFQHRKFNRGQIIFNEGDVAKWLYLVYDGKVRILKNSARGKELMLEVISPGEIFGGIGVFDGTTYPATAQAMEPTEVLQLTRYDFFTLLARYPALAQQALTYFGQRLKDAHELMRIIAIERVQTRIAAILLKLMERELRERPKIPNFKDGIKLNVILTRADIADMVGTTVETAIRVMSRFTKSGWIKTTHGRISILNPTALQQIVQQR